MRLLFHFLQIVAILIVVAGGFIFVLFLCQLVLFFPFLRPSLVQQLTPRLCYVTRHKRAHQLSVIRETADTENIGDVMRKWTSPRDWRETPSRFIFGRFFFTCPQKLEIERFLIPPYRQFGSFASSMENESHSPFCVTFCYTVLLLLWYFSFNETGNKILKDGMSQKYCTTFRYACIGAQGKRSLITTSTLSEICSVLMRNIYVS